MHFCVYFKTLKFFLCCYRPHSLAKQRDNALGSVHPSVCQSVSTLMPEQHVYGSNRKGRTNTSQTHKWTDVFCQMHIRGKSFNHIWKGQVWVEKLWKEIDLVCLSSHESFLCCWFSLRFTCDLSATTLSKNTSSTKEKYAYNLKMGIFVGNGDLIPILLRWVFHFQLKSELMKALTVSDQTLSFIG